MISIDENNVEWLGWLNIKDEALSVYARVLPATQKIDIHSIQVDCKLFEKMNIIKEKKWFIDHITHLDSIDRLPQFLQESLSAEPLSMEDNIVDNIPQVLISELDSIGWEHFVSVNQSMDVIKLKTSDKRGFEHQCEVHISQQYPLVPPVLTVDLPVSIHLSDCALENEDPYSFKQILSTVQTEIDKYDDLFTVLRDLDDHTNVLEPNSRSFCIVSRRLAVSRTCSIKITLDPRAPRQLCPVAYMGPHEEISALRRNFGKNVGKWSPTELVRLNLEKLFETSFIEPNTTEDLSYLNECGICYSYQLAVGGKGMPTSESSLASVSMPPSSSSSRGSALSPRGTGDLHRQLQPKPQPQEGAEMMITPDQMCLNRKCGRLFHTACLISWLQAVPTNKTSFGTLFGSCPYCSESISVRTFR
jgi:E3 ubiquitin-protein ligase FANCL